MHLRWLEPWELHWLFVHFRDRLHQIVWVQRKWNLGLVLYVVSLSYFILWHRKESAHCCFVVSLTIHLSILNFSLKAWGTWCCCGRHSTCGCSSFACSSTDTESSMCIILVIFFSLLSCSYDLLSPRYSNFKKNTCIVVFHSLACTFILTAGD